MKDNAMKTLILLLLMTSVCWAYEYVDPELIKDQCDFERPSHVPRTAFYKKFCMCTNLKDFFDAKGFKTDHHGIEHISIRQGDHEVLYVGGIDNFKGIIPDKFNVKISCPDGYVISGKLYDRVKERPCKHTYMTSGCANKQVPGVNICEDILISTCADLPVSTDAELKCVKQE